MLNTTYSSASWELPLLARANEAFSGQSRRRADALAGADSTPAALERAYQHCTALTAHHSRSFYLASGLMPAEKRRAVRALYAFCRVADDIVDQPANHTASPPINRLAEWQRKSLGVKAPADDLVAMAWVDTRRRYRIPRRYAEQLLEGIANDLTPRRYATFDELAVYAYHVAATVGLMSMHITGFDGPQAIPYAIKLGVALQMTNILRDIGEDWRMGRLYLPLDELEFFGLTEADIAAGRVDERWRAFMRFQIGRCRRLYAEAWPGIFLLHPDGRLAIAAAAEFYAAILDDIEANDYDVFTRRAHLSAWGKLRRLPGLWLKVVSGSKITAIPAECAVTK
jgi:phytoene synthase